MSKVSVIVPIYNVEKYIEKCIKSLLEQTFKDFEVLAVSDGSPDNSMKIVEKYAKDDNRIKTFYKENGGYGSVLEFAIKNASSEYFLICDPDDWLANDAIETLYNCAKKENVDLVVGDYYLTYNDTNEVVEKKAENPYYKIEKNVKIEGDDLNNFVYMTVSPHAKLYKVKNALNVKLPHKVSYTDRSLYLIYVNSCKSAVYINKPLAFYLVDRPGNTMTETAEKIYKTKVFNAKFTVENAIFEQIKNEYNPHILYRNYIESIFFLSDIRRMENDIEKKEAYEKTIEFMLKLKPYKKELLKCVKGKNIINTALRKILMGMFFYSFTRKIAIHMYISIF